MHTVNIGSLVLGWTEGSGVKLVGRLVVGIAVCRVGWDVVGASVINDGGEVGSGRFVGSGVSRVGWAVGVSVSSGDGGPVGTGIPEGVWFGEPSVGIVVGTGLSGSVGDLVGSKSVGIMVVGFANEGVGTLVGVGFGGLSTGVVVGDGLESGIGGSVGPLIGEESVGLSVGDADGGTGALGVGVMVGKGAGVVGDIVGALVMDSVGFSVLVEGGRGGGRTKGGEGREGGRTKGGGSRGGGPGRGRPLVLSLCAGRRRCRLCEGLVR